MSVETAPQVDVAVVGSINQDLGIGLDRTPRAGETVFGDDVRRMPGGKGANQVVGAARLGLRAAMIGAVGTDSSGAQLRDRLEAEGVDVEHVSELDAPTGLAVVLIDRVGESTIVVSPGANGRLTGAHVDAAGRAVAGARAVLCQLEVPLEVVERAAQIATGLVVLNPAPGRPLSAQLLGAVDVLVPNRHELATITGRDVVETLEEVAAAARSLEGPNTVVVTLGSSGALVVENGDVSHVPEVTVSPVDTTGAGDSFCAGLVAGLLDGTPLLESVRFATRIAAATTLRPGAMDSLPRRDEIEELLNAESG